MHPKYDKILGVRVDGTPISSVLRKISASLAKREKFSPARRFYIVTPNPEIVLASQADPLLRKILNFSNVSLPDGVGLRLANLILNHKDLTIVHGRKVFYEICRLANKKGWKIFILGGEDWVNQKAVRVIKEKFPAVKIFGDSGPNLDNSASSVIQRDTLVLKETIDKINKIGPDILFVALGAPKQEKFIYKWLPKLNVRGAMVIGGALDYLAGKYSLPPKFMEDLEIEWLWRLITQPWRVVRIMKATLVFLFVVVLAKFKRS